MRWKGGGGKLNLRRGRKREARRKRDGWKGRVEMRWKGGGGMLNLLNVKCMQLC